eukprot:CAMPEP_0170809558 /NCGR_PEP_ID=MMETSP0733-20121128/34108_1 /TAXON_ID=186038 /ORGANISM="Fragilariopsis kerguelensis, Strain L26-C5" /LENGTH=95 /DNA_ID=CAMNT_0011165295 /DNA_START=459 /DNA_END=747 /DNA_ORIENTATION=+
MTPSSLRSPPPPPYILQMDLGSIQIPFIGPYHNHRGGIIILLNDKDDDDDPYLYRFQSNSDCDVGDKPLRPRPPLLPVLLSHHGLDHNDHNHYYQ